MTADELARRMSPREFVERMALDTSRAAKPAAPRTPEEQIKAGLMAKASADLDEQQRKLKRKR